MTELDARDALLQAHVPALMVPRYTNFPPLKANGHRYLVAEDGLWLEVRRPWLHLVWPVSTEHGLKLPYGPVLADEMTFAFDLESADFHALLDAFARDARAVAPDECAAWLVWDEQRGRLDYRPLIAINAGPGGIEFHRPRLADHEHLAVDLHSHGATLAFFSATDDKDDAGEVKLAGVLGHVGTGEEHFCMRLCAHGLFIAFDDERRCRVCGCTDADPCPDGCAWVKPDLCSSCA